MQRDSWFEIIKFVINKLNVLLAWSMPVAKNIWFVEKEYSDTPMKVIFKHKFNLNPLKTINLQIPFNHNRTLANQISLQNHNLTSTDHNVLFITTNRIWKHREYASITPDVLEDMSIVLPLRHDNAILVHKFELR